MASPLTTRITFIKFIAFFVAIWGPSTASREDENASKLCLGTVPRADPSSRRTGCADKKIPIDHRIENISRRCVCGGGGGPRIEAAERVGGKVPLRNPPTPHKKRSKILTTVEIT